MALRLALVLLLGAAAAVGVASLKILDKSGCRITTDGGAIDLTRLTAAGGRGIFKANDRLNSSVYLWSPCKNYDFADSGYNVTGFRVDNCHSFAVAQYETSIQTCTFVADQSAAAYHVEDDHLLVSYVHGLYSFTIALLCDRSVGGDTWTLTDDDLWSPEFELRSENCCLKRSIDSFSFLWRLPSYGTLTCVAVGILACLYILFGSIYKKLKFKTRSWDSLPHSGFWLDLPHLVRDGALFVVCRYKRRHAYSKIVHPKKGNSSVLDDDSEDEYHSVINPRASVKKRSPDYSYDAASDAADEPHFNDGGHERVSLLTKPRDSNDSEVDPVAV